MGKKADTVFESGADDDVAAEDVYDERETADTDEDVQSPLDVVTEAGRKASEDIRERKGIAKDLAETVKVEDDVTEIDRDKAKDRFVSITGGFDSPINEAEDALIDSAIDSLSDSEGQGTNTRLAFEDVTRRIEAGDHESAAGLADMLQSISDDPGVVELLDLDAEAALFNEYIKKAIDLGIPEAIDTILKKIRDDKRRRELMVQNLRRAALMSDLETVNKVIDEVGASGALARVPNLITLLFSSYRFPRGTTTGNYNSEFNRLMNTVNRLDGQWYLTQRAGEEITDLEHLTYASNDALTLLKRDGQFRDLAMVAPAWRSRDLRRILRNTYSRIAFPPLFANE